MVKKTNELVEAIKRSFEYFFDKDVPFSYKLIPGIALVYLLVPFDFVTDFLPFLGQLDDISILTLSFATFKKIAEEKKLKS